MDNSTFEKLLQKTTNEYESKKVEIKPLKRKETVKKASPKKEIINTNETDNKSSNKIEKKDKDIITEEDNYKVEDKDFRVEEDDSKIEDNDKDKINYLASILGLNVEKVKETLVNMGLTISDLSNKENVVSFLQEVFNKSNPAELLNIPNIKQLMSDIDKLVEASSEILSTQNTNTIIEESNTDLYKKAIDKDKSTENKESIKAETTKNKTTEETEVKPEQTKVDENNVPDKNILLENETLEETPKTENKEDKNIEVKIVEDNINKQSDSTKNNFFNNEDDKKDESILSNKADVVNQSNEVKFEKVIATKTEIIQTNKVIDNKNVIEQILENLKVEVRGNESSIRMTLHPETLGDVTVKISTQNGIVTASFIAENEKVKEILKANFNELKNVLQEQGLNISSLSVSVGQENNKNQMNEFARKQEKSPNRIHDIISKLSFDDKEISGNNVYNNNYDGLEVNVNYTA